MKNIAKSSVRALLIAGILAGTAVAVYAQRSTIGDGLRDVRYLHWGWVAAVSLTEILSMLAMALLYRTLLRASSVRLTVTWILTSSYIANGISISVPVIGAGMAGRLAYRRFREAGADAAAASLALTLAGIVSTVTLVPIVVAAALLSGNPAASVSGLLAAVALVTGAAVVMVELRSERGRERLLRLIALSLRCTQRIIRRPKGQPDVLALAVLASIQRIRLGKSVLTQALLWGLVNWWADVACLAFALRAAGITTLSIGKILLVWTAATGASSLSPTPAGIGAVEVAMAAALTAAGVKGSHAITAILVYRVTTFKGLGTLGSVLYHRINHRRRRIPEGSGSAPDSEIAARDDLRGAG
ncbi:MAG TPA: lysylphosphatidylglycerol synthase transmembrane domain-containing protein [Streptosporangiaceae bacterium]